LVGKYGIVRDNSSLFIWKQNGYLPFEIKRLGMKDGSYSVSVFPLGTSFSSVGDPRTIQGLNIMGTRTDSISYQFKNTVNVGDTIQYVLVLNNGFFNVYDTVTRIFGYPVNVFNDNLSNTSKWTGNWAITSGQYYSPSSCMTDSPFGNYLPNANKTTTLINEIDLNNTILMVLEFRAKWALEKDYDYVQLSISKDNGTTWTPLTGKYTHPGTSNQSYGLPVYDGKKNQWMHEVISLNTYMGNKVKFRFRLKADAATELDGYYFDDFNISMLLDPTPADKFDEKTSVIGSPYPNPADETFELSYHLPEATSDAILHITSVTGVEVFSIKLSQQAGIIKPDISLLPPGIYFLNITSKGLKTQVKKLVVR
jgi:hypothetical protein